MVDVTYDIFEKLPNGGLVWREFTVGRNQSLEKLKELASVSTNEFFAIHLPTKAIIGVMNAKKSSSAA